MNRQARKMLSLLQDEILQCKQCDRLVAWREEVAEKKRASYQDEEYWGKPVPSFGDPQGQLLLVGLAPGAHGANRTGRVFTGDRSGDWLFSAMHRAGFANQETAISRDDGLKLIDANISMCVRCAPPENKPTPEERDACLQFLERELPLLPNVKVILCLGSFAWNGVLKTLRKLDLILKPQPKFGHGAEIALGPFVLLGSFHPSQQNTFTGKLTREMLDDIFQRAKELLSR